MKNKFIFFIFLLPLFLAGCGIAINLQGKVAGVSSGEFFYQDGNLVNEYKADIESVWAACEKSIIDLKAKDIQKKRTISSGMINALIHDEKTILRVEYVSRNLTSVSVFVGPVGNNMASRLIHEKIVGNMTTK